MAGPDPSEFKNLVDKVQRLQIQVAVLIALSVWQVLGVATAIPDPSAAVPAVLHLFT